jgi:hypothetical protein
MAGIYEYLFGGEDDKNLFDNLFGEDDEYSQTEESAFADLIDSDSDFADLYENVLADPNYGTTDVNSFMYEEDDPFAWLYESDPEFAGELLSDDFFDTENSQYGEYDWGEILSDNEDDWQGYLGLGIGPKLNEAFTGGEGLSGFLSTLLGGGSSGGKKDGGGILGSLIGGSKNMLDNDLIKILLGKKLLDDDREGKGGYVPIGQEAYGGGGGQPSYQISNIQPALLPGMAYANQPTTFNADPPPGMQAGGLASIPQGNKGLAKLPKDVRNNMGYMQAGGVASLENMMDGPGDITQAMLEPGEFVMTRKATENLTPEYLYNLMHQAENAGRMR